jgi:hypothetical protein
MACVSAPILQPVAEQLWIADGAPVRFFTMPFPTRMTVIRCTHDRLFIHSPIRLTPELQSAIEGLGRVEYLISPNKIHHLFMAEWASAYPQARSYASPGLGAKRPDLRFQAELGDGPAAEWQEEIDQLAFRGSRVMEEIVFFHRASRTLILADLIENFDPATLGLVHRLLARLGRVLAPHGQTPLDYRMTFRDRDAARQALARIVEWRPERIIFSHGLWVESDAEAFLRRAFAWLAS